MKLHEKKLKLDYAVPKMQGIKLFEIRKNDCDYQVGDLVHYVVVDALGNSLIEQGYFTNETIRQVAYYFHTSIFEITYITSYEQKDDYIVYSEKRIN